MNKVSTRTIGKYRTIRAVPEIGYDLCSEDDFSHLLELQGMKDRAIDYPCGFALIHDGEILELWGYTGTVPYLSKFVRLLYSKSIHDTIDQMWFSIGELHKTKRYPKRLKTFRNKVYAWIERTQDSTRALSDHDLARFSAIVAYNAHWIDKSALELYDVDPDSLWIER